MAIYNVARINNKKFDISRVCTRFNKNPNLTLDDIAKEYDISRGELIERLKKGAGGDERSRVDGVLREDKRRKKRSKAVKQEQKDKKVETAKESFMTSNFDEQRKNLNEQIAQAENALNESIQRVSELEELVAKSQQEGFRLTDLVTNIETQIDELQKRLEDANKDLKNLKNLFQNERRKCEEGTRTLTEARERVKANREELELLWLQLEELESHRIFLVAPNYNLTEYQGTNRYVSSVQREGVEYVYVKSDADSLGLVETKKLMDLTGFSIDELIAVYDFAWLVWIYKSKPDYEIHVLNEDERVQQIIDYLVK